MRRFDVVIVGGGAIGSAAAYFLKRLGGPGLHVLVCEADETFAGGATLQAAGGLRQTFTLEENIRMSAYGAQFVRGAADELAVDGDSPDLGFRHTPYLYLVAGDLDVTRLRATHNLRTVLGVPGLWLDRNALRARYPWLAVEDVDAGLIGGHDEGVVDPEALLRALRRKATALGAVFEEARVVGFNNEAGRIQAVHLGSGERIGCGGVINAAGAQSPALAALAGCDVPIEPRDAATFMFRAATPLPPDMPIVVDRMQGLHFKRAGDVFLASLPLARGNSAPGTVDHDLFEARIWPALALRVTAFEAIRFAGAWAGTIDASPLDGNPFIGPHPRVSNFFSVAGFNGHGLQHAPAAGRAVAELVVYGEYRAIDLSRFGSYRLKERCGYKEHF